LLIEITVKLLLLCASSGVAAWKAG